MLTQDEIIQKLDQEINAGRGESMFNEVQFSVDFEASTVLSFDADNDEWLVNAFTVSGTDVEVAAMPMMSFPGASL